MSGLACEPRTCVSADLSMLSCSTRLCSVLDSTMYAGPHHVHTQSTWYTSCTSCKTFYIYAVPQVLPGTCSTRLLLISCSTYDTSPPYLMATAVRYRYSNREYELKHVGSMQGPTVFTDGIVCVDPYSVHTGASPRQAPTTAGRRDLPSYLAR